MSTEIELELYVDDEFAAGVCGPRDQAMREMRRYWAQYSQDGKCTVYEVTRTQIDIEVVLGLTAQETRACELCKAEQVTAPATLCRACEDCL